MKEYTEIIRATEIAGCPVSLHLSPEAPDWLIERVTKFVRELARMEAPPEPEPDAFEEAIQRFTLVNGPDLGNPASVFRYTKESVGFLRDALRALDERMRRLEGR